MKTSIENNISVFWNFSVMKGKMNASIFKKDKILNSIIFPVFINMVNGLRRMKISPYYLFNDKSVFQNIFCFRGIGMTRRIDDPITVRIDMYPSSPTDAFFRKKTRHPFGELGRNCFSYGRIFPHFFRLLSDYLFRIARMVTTKKCTWKPSTKIVSFFKQGISSKDFFVKFRSFVNAAWHKHLHDILERVTQRGCYV